MEKPFVIYRSSAGSGKTYTLALEYLKLALQSQAAFRNILAVTFTNKATREMKGRIVQFLYELANDKNPVLKEVLMSASGLEANPLQERARQVLSNILHGYAHFSVMTIDSFFQKVIRAFAREMGLQAGFAIELDQDKVLDEVIDGLLSEIGEPEHQRLRQWLVRFSEEKVESGKAWDFRRDVKQLATELFKEEYKISQHDNDDDITPHHQHFEQVLAQLKAIVKTFENHMQSFGKEGLYMMEKHGLHYTDFAYGKSGVGNYFVRLDDKSDFDPKKRGREAAEDAERWTTKSSKNKALILNVVELGLQQILQKAISLYDRDFILYQSASQLLKFIYAYGILRDIGKKLNDYKRENDLMLISDASVFLQGVIGKDDTPFIYEKIGSNFQHFLIDEFQDTSGMQWNNFRPLIENSLDAGYRNLVVGDVKQSIYRWRGGDWQLLLEKIQQDVSPWNTATFNLDMNYRSHKNIVDFNNWLFSVLPILVRNEITSKLETLNEHERQILTSRAEIITQAYADVQQKLPTSKQSPEVWQGFVQIEMLDKKHTSDYEDVESVHWKEQVRHKLPVLVESLQDQGFALRDIAFLVRDKRAGKEVVDTLMQHKSSGSAKKGYKYDVISSESLFLSASLNVGFLIDLLRIFDNPQDAIAKGSAVFKYHKLQHKTISSDELHRIFVSASQEDNEEQFQEFLQWFPQDFRNLYTYLGKLPLYELIEHLISLFDLNQSDELAYLQAFQDAVLAYSGQESGDLFTFLQWWEEKGKENAVRVSEGVDAMQIFTIHKAKGLQFKVVIIPFCDWELDHRPGQDNIIWTATQQPPFDQFGLMPMRYSSRLADTYFNLDYFQEMIRAYIDNLNLIYVAFTRAEEALFTFSAPAVRSNGSCPVNSVANALYNVCSSSQDNERMAGAWDEEKRVFTLGKMQVSTQSSQVKSDSIAINHYPAERWRDRLTVRPFAKGFFSFAGRGEMIVNYAVIYRDVLASMYDASDLQRSLEKVYFERGINIRDKAIILKNLQEALSILPLAEWFSEENGQVFLKRPFSNFQGSLYQVDRVIFHQEKAIIIQFDEKADDKQSLNALKGTAQILRKMGKQVDVYLFDTLQMKAHGLASTEAAK